MKKIAIIGLDCVPDWLAFEALQSELPTLHSLMEHGVWGTLVSTDPPITIPAWTTITTGRDPGELGLYGFRNRLAYDEYALTVVNDSHVVAPRVWDYLEQQGAESILVAIPQTYPPRVHRGVTVAGFPTPAFDTAYCYPPEVSDEVVRHANGKYVNDIKEFRKKEKAQLLVDLYAAAQSRFAVARHFVAHKSWDFFMMVETTTDRLHHGFWAAYDPDHPRHAKNTSFARAIPEFYRFIDQQIASLLALLPDEATVMVISDHGAGALKGVVAINEWLIAHGYLKLLGPPEGESSLSPEMVDWSRTTAWGEGGYYGRIFLNVTGREPHGVVHPAEYESFRDELARRLRTITDPSSGLSIANTVLKPTELYPTCRNVPPDLMVYFDDLDYRSSGLVGGGEIFPAGEGEGMDEANHKHHGVFIMARLSELRQGLQRGQRIGPLSCLDVVPTVLQEFGISVPMELRGLPAVREPATSASPETGLPGLPPQSLNAESERKGFTEEEEEIITQRLKDLGYI